jgi:tmRNA-binding protein
VPHQKGIKSVAQNRKAWHDYFVEEKYECGLALFGTEVKSIRQGRVNLKESWAQIRGGEIIYQSKDHSIPQMMVTCGEITYDQIRGHESRNLLTRALGYKDDVTAEHFAGRIRRGDRLLLCTDGFWEWVLEADMVACARGKTAQEWLNGMCALIAQRFDEEADNYSAIAIVAE